MHLLEKEKEEEEEHESRKSVLKPPPLPYPGKGERRNNERKISAGTNHGEREGGWKKEEDRSKNAQNSPDISQEELRHKKFEITGEFVKTVNRVLLHEWFVLQYVLQIVSKLHPIL